MALAFVSSTISSNTATPATAVPCTYPASIGPGDVLVCMVGVKPFSATINTPPGWMFLAQATNGTTAPGVGTGSMRQAVFAREAAGNETGSLTVSITSGDSAWVALYRYTKAAGQAVNFAAATGIDVTAGTTWSVSFGSNPGITVGDQIVIGGAWPLGTANTVSATALTATGCTFTGIVAAGDQNPRVTTGNDSGGNVFHANCTVGTASANPTWTATHTSAVNNGGAAVLLRVREIAPGTPAATLTLGAHQ